jgi:hypothetical protein
MNKIVFGLVLSFVASSAFAQNLYTMRSYFNPSRDKYFKLDKATVPQSPKEQLEKAESNWAYYYRESNISVRSVTLLGKICCSQLDSFLSDATNPDSVWFPVGNYFDIKNVKVVKGSEIKALIYKQWKQEFERLIRPGFYVFRIEWVSGDKFFHSFCFTDDEDIVYDAMFSNAPFMTIDSTAPYFYCKIWKLWANFVAYDAERYLVGRIKISDDGRCCASHCPQHCNINSQTYMEGGCAQIYLESDLDITKACIARGSWAWAAGYRKIVDFQDTTGFITYQLAGAFGVGATQNYYNYKKCEQLKNFDIYDTKHNPKPAHKAIPKKKK